MNNLGFKAHYYTRRALLKVLGPAQLSREQDPLVQLERQWEQRFGPRKHKAATPPRPFKRHFAGAGGHKPGAQE